MEHLDEVSSDFSIDSNGCQEENNCVMTVQQTDFQSRIQQTVIDETNEVHYQLFKPTLSETMHWNAESNQPKTMSQHNQHQAADEKDQQHSTNKSETLRNRRVSIIDETNRTVNKISKKRKKTTRLRKPLQNDELLKNYFEMDKVSSNEVTTFKIMKESEATSSNASSHQDQQVSGVPSESFITKETFHVYSKLSESDDSRKTISSGQQQHLLTESGQPSAYSQISPIPFQELLNSETMQSYSRHSNSSLSFPPTSEDPNAESSENLIPNNETQNEIDNNSSFLSGFSQFTPESLDLLQLLMQLTDNSDQQQNTNSQQNDQN